MIDCRIPSKQKCGPCKNKVVAQIWYRFLIAISPKLRCANPVFGCKTPQNADLCPPAVAVRLGGRAQLGVEDETHASIPINFREEILRYLLRGT